MLFRFSFFCSNVGIKKEYEWNLIQICYIVNEWFLIQICYMKNQVFNYVTNFIYFILHLLNRKTISRHMLNWQWSDCFTLRSKKNDLFSIFHLYTKWCCSLRLRSKWITKNYGKMYSCFIEIIRLEIYLLYCPAKYK